MKINLYVSVHKSDKEIELSVTTNSGLMKLSRFEAIKLRNFLNEFINGNLDEEVEEENEEK